MLCANQEQHKERFSWFPVKILVFSTPSFANFKIFLKTGKKAFWQGLPLFVIFYSTNCCRSSFTLGQNVPRMVPVIGAYTVEHFLKVKGLLRKVYRGNFFRSLDPKDSGPNLDNGTRPHQESIFLTGCFYLLIYTLTHPFFLTNSFGGIFWEIWTQRIIGKTGSDGVGKKCEWHYLKEL